eukprot:s1923_g2.t3
MVDAAEVEALEALVTKLKEDPSLVYDPKLSFFKEFVLSWGAKVPEAKPKPKEEPKAPDTEPANAEDDEEEEPEEPEEPDPERLEEDPEPYPPQGPSDNRELSDSELDNQGELKQAAAEALEDGNLAKALEKLTEAFQIGNVSAMMFAKRAELLLKLKKPCACIALARFNEVGATSVQSLRPSSVEFAEGADCKPHYSKLPSGGRGVVATVCVKLSQKEVYGEIATRSRIGAYVRLGSEVIFAHHEPPTDLSTEPLLLEVYGFDFPVLPETIKLRRHLKQVLGQDYSRKSAAAWYEKHKDEFCPLKDSKLRRILASVFEVHSLMFLPEWAVSRALWGMLNICTQTYIGFEFWDEGKNGIRVTVRSSTPADPDDVECLQNARDLFQLQASAPGDRQIGERLFKSGYSVGSMNFGRALGHPGAKPDVIAKLFSAANLWGPAKSGWQSFDDTWLCTDRRDHLGQVAEEQGRIIWITPGAGRIPSTPGQRDSEVLPNEAQCISYETEVAAPKTWLQPTLILLAVTCLLLTILRSLSSVLEA